MTILDMLRPHHPTILAAAVAFIAAWGLPRLGWSLLAGAAAGLGVLAGWWFALGLLTATPRQLPERLPLLMLGLVLLMPLLGWPVRRWRWLAVPALGLGAAWVGWWMAGAPLNLPDLARGGPVLLAVAAATLLLALGATPRWAPPVAAGALLLALSLAGLRGPQPILAAALCAASVAAALAGIGREAGERPRLAALPVAGGIIGLAAIPVLARGATADWLAAAAPLAALLVGAPLGGWVNRHCGAPAGAALAGCSVAAATYLFA